MQELPVSVCMATCNGAAFVGGQIESILCQLGEKDELIVSDDGSTDATCAIVAGYDDPRIRLFSDRCFGNPVKNFEYALQHARHGLVALSDQDDLWLPGRLELIRKRLGPFVDHPALIMMDGELIDAAGHLLGETIFSRTHAGAGVLKNIYDNTYTGCCLAFSRPLLEIALPFPERIPMHDMWLGLLAEFFGRVEFVEVKTILYRRHGGNLSRRSDSRIVQVMRRLNLVQALICRYASVKYRKLQN